MLETSLDYTLGCCANQYYLITSLRNICILENWGENKLREMHKRRERQQHNNVLTCLQFLGFFPWNPFKYMWLRTRCDFVCPSIFLDLHETIDYKFRRKKIQKGLVQSKVKPASELNKWEKGQLTCCWSRLNSLGLVFLGTNCSVSILTGVLLWVGDPSATHCGKENQHIRTHSQGHVQFLCACCI